MEEIVKNLAGQGVLGLVVVYLIMQLREARSDIKAERAEVKALTERYEAKFEKMNEKTERVATEVTRAFESAISSRRRLLSPPKGVDDE